MNSFPIIEKSIGCHTVMPACRESFFRQRKIPVKPE
jgi:hypothetical protein